MNFNDVVSFTDLTWSGWNQVRKTIQNIFEYLQKTQITEQCTNVIKKTMQRAFEMLIHSKEIIKIGGGRYTSYQQNGENEYGYRRTEKQN
ncbi:MAG: hypothetical protein IJI14_05085 [Anaerolineaceae bacterium]|nr:hypothetical protein [Anaerolineaceae bacterium]